MKQFSLEEYLKNPSKKIVTRDGRNVTIHCTNCAGPRPVVACAGPRPVVAQIEGDNYSLNFDKYGRYCFGTSDVDLFFVPEKHEGWVNVLEGPNGRRWLGSIWNSKQAAKDNAKYNEDFITTIKIEWEE